MSRLGVLSLPIAMLSGMTAGEAIADTVKKKGSPNRPCVTICPAENYQRDDKRKETVLGAFFFGVFWNISEVISEEIGWLPTTLFVKFGIIVFLLLFSFIIKRKLVLTKAATKTKFMLLLMGSIEAGAVAIVNFGLTIGDAILITPIASALSIVTITLAFIFLKDKDTKLQGLGMISAVVGIIVTAF
jgi:uncharacterized membrane protein